MHTHNRSFAAGIAVGIGLLSCWSMAGAQISVSDSGTPGYSQAIAVPPGVAGMSPKLSLVYAGGGVNGPVGHGWSVQGLSSITRCPLTVPVDGIKAGVNYGVNDRLCLDGQRLVQVDSAGAPLVGSTSNDAQGSASNYYREYRTEKDTFARIRSYGYANGDSSGASGPAYFKVWTKSGQVYEYGASPSADANTKALISPVGKTVGIAWAVSRISDTLGNSIDFKYSVTSPAWGSNTGTGREWNIAEIQYAGNKVVFNYAERTVDRSEAYHGGNKNLSTQLLQSITTYVNSPNPTVLGPAAGAVAVKTTRLTYDNGPITKRARLTALRECAGDASSTRCLPATTFTYSPGGNEAYQPMGSAFNLASNTNLHSLNGTYGVLAADFNGDGRTDFIRWSNTTSQNQLWFSNGDGSFTQQTNFNITNTWVQTSDSCFLSIVADINADGLPDLFRYRASKNPNNIDCGAPVSHGTTVYINNGDGTFTQNSYVGPSLHLHRRISSLGTIGYDPVKYYLSEGANFFVLDVDSDGKPDIVTTVRPYVQQSIDGEVMPDPCATSVCTRVYKGNGNGSFTEIPTNIANRTLYVAPYLAGDLGAPSKIADLDGDGLADLVNVNGKSDLSGAAAQYFTFNTSPAYRSRGNGSFDFMSSSQTCSHPLDYNGDGRTDCLVPSGSASANKLQLADGSGTLPNVANFNLTGSGQELSGSSAGITVVDANGDGRHDILRWHNTPASNKLYLSNGDGTFTESGSFNFSTIQLKKIDGTVDFMTGDFTGKGNVEILVMGSNGTNQLYVKTTDTPPDQLLSVTSGTGAYSDVQYTSISAKQPTAGLGARYTSDRGTANASTGNKIDVAFPMHVVITHRASNGVGGYLTTEYSYAGLKADMQGRGLLGFREVRRQTIGPNGEPLTVATQYLQGHPYTGVANRTETYRSALNSTAPSLLLSRTVNIYCDHTAAAGAENSATEAAPCATTAKIQRPYVRKTTEEGWDLQGMALPTVTTTNTFNAWGDPTQVVVTTTGTVGVEGIAQTATKTTTNTYSAPDITGDRWVLGRLTRASVQSSVPNSLGQLTTWAGTTPYATATNGNPPPVPPSVAITPAMIMMILGDD